MSLRCSLLGHEMGPPVEQEEQKDDVTVRTRTRTCLRCGETNVELENTRVAIEEVEQQVTTEPETQPVVDDHDDVEPDHPRVDESELEPVEEMELPEYDEADLPDDELAAEGDAVIIDDAGQPAEHEEVAAQQFQGGEVIEHAFGEAHHQPPEQEVDYDHNAFKGDVPDDEDFSPDPGEILTDEPDEEPADNEPKQTPVEANHVPDDSQVLQCRSCPFSEPHAHSALREGDICGGCGAGYLVLVDSTGE